jgi:hypothetical protein
VRRRVGLGTPARLARGAPGFAHLEALVAIALVAVALVPALQALQAGVSGGRALGDIATLDAGLREKLEEVLAKPFAELNAETYLPGGNTTSSVSASLSDPVGPARRVVILYRSDGSSVSSADTGLLRIRVARDGSDTALETLKARWW